MISTNRKYLNPSFLLRLTIFSHLRHANYPTLLERDEEDRYWRASLIYPFFILIAHLFLYSTSSTLVLLLDENLMPA